VLVTFLAFSENLPRALEKFGVRLYSWFGISPAVADANWLALTVFAVLVAVMVLVGMGWFLKQKPAPPKP